METDRAEDGPSETAAPRLEMWRITVSPKAEGIDRWDHPNAKEYYIAAETRALAEEAARKQYIDELELLVGYAAIHPLLVEQIGPNTTQVRWGDDRPDSWWRRLFR